ncbi:Maf family protein [Desulfofustis glycolicus]
MSSFIPDQPDDNEAAGEMFATVKPLVLASASPRRKRMLTELGLHFRICPASLDERPKEGEDPGDYVCRIAEEKARMVGVNFASEWILAADTTVVLDSEALGKPRDSEEAVTMLCRLAGREHFVLTGFTLYCRRESFCHVDCVATRVRFAPFGRQLARAYVRTGESLDKAGGYGIQGKGGMLVAAIDGSYSNVVGLPLAEISDLLTELGIIEIRSSRCKPAHNG